MYCIKQSNPYFICNSLLLNIFACILQIEIFGARKQGAAQGKERHLLLQFSFVLGVALLTSAIQHILDQRNPQLIAFYLRTKYLQTYLHRCRAGASLSTQDHIIFYFVLDSADNNHFHDKFAIFFSSHFSITDNVQHFKCSDFSLGHLRQGECF